VSVVITACVGIDDLFLDALDLASTRGRTAEDLRANLAIGGSVWTVANDDESLVRRVSEGEREAYERIICAADEIADELRTAWAAVYGRHSDPSDAWDHAIKAVELSLWPIVTPDKAKATRGTIIDRLSTKGDDFALRLATSSDRTSCTDRRRWLCDPACDQR